WGAGTGSRSATRSGCGAARGGRTGRAGAGRRRARSASRATGSSWAAPLEEEGECTQPIAGRRQHRVADAERGERPPKPASLLGRGGREARAQPGVARVDAELSPCLGIDEPELACVRQLLLARVADLDGEHVVGAGELEQGLAPVARPAEVGDDDDQRSLSGERT